MPISPLLAIFRGTHQMPYKVDIKGKVAKQIADLPDREKSKVLEAIRGLKTNPRPDGCKKLKGHKGLYRVDAARDYRIIYSVEDSIMVVEVLKVGGRKDV